VARRALPPLAAIAAVALVSLSPTLVHYAAEAKPYAVDAFITLVLVDRTLAVTEREAGESRWWTLAIVGGVAIASSTPAFFVLAGVGACLTAHAFSRRDTTFARRTAAVGVIWAATFGALLATVFRPLLGEASPLGRYMHWYWSPSFLTPDPPGLATKVSSVLWATLTSTFMGDPPCR